MSEAETVENEEKIWIMINSGPYTAEQFLDKIVALAESLDMTIGGSIEEVE